MDLNKKQKISERNKRYYAKHKTELSEKKKKHYSEHRKEYAERMKKYYLENKKKLAIKHKEYYEEHKFQPNKKLSRLIEINKAIPSIEELQSKDKPTLVNLRVDTEKNILEALEVISKGMKYEKICKELIDCAKNIFQNCDDIKS